MQDDANSEQPTLKRIPWNKGKLVGAKPPLRQKHVWAVNRRRTFSSYAGFLLRSQFERKVLSCWTMNDPSTDSNFFIRFYSIYPVLTA
jgi:hypothetical protein